MTAIKAELRQYKQLASRPVIQIILEAPIETAHEITSVLGWPNPGESMWVGVARIHDDKE